MPAPKGNKNAKGNKGGGRKSVYRPEYAEMAAKIALLGATDADLARVFNVAETTINTWKRDRVEFSDALKKGKWEADAVVARSLYRRAIGYSHKAVKILTVSRGNNEGAEVEQIPYVERYAPDTTACIFWLKNRKPDQWRDKLEVDLRDGLADRLKAARDRANG